MKTPDGLRIHGVKTYGTRAVAVYLGGIDPGKVNNWIHSSNGFPKPDITTCGPDNVSGYSWFEESLPGIRAWYEVWEGLNPAEAAAYWNKVDELIETSPRRGDIRVRRPSPQIPGQTSVQL
jgi:hypothetical protein